MTTHATPNRTSLVPHYTFADTLAEQEAQLKVRFDGTCRLRTPSGLKAVRCENETIETFCLEDKLVEFEVTAGKTYQVLL